ncbi:MAG: hypothetical protein HY606_03435 [Planctomycetes bacterium]|nr:hypothetical protein [Planctomycetota bacterium]
MKAKAGKEVGLEERIKRYDYAISKRLSELKGKEDKVESDPLLRKIKAKKRRISRKIWRVSLLDPAKMLTFSQKKLEVLNQVRDVLTKKGFRADSPRIKSISKRIKSLNKKIKRLNKAAPKPEEAPAPAPAQPAAPVEQTAKPEAGNK